jgi:hypothetical protein
MPPDAGRIIGRTVSFAGFVDEAGDPRAVALQRTGADEDRRPWILSPMYTRCPHTCSALTAGLRGALERSGLADSEYRVASFSFDPDETSEGLQEFRSKMHLPERWATLRAADESALDRLLDSLDFRTMRTADGEFQHPNLVAVLSADRAVAGFVFGVRPAPEDLARLVRDARAGVSSGARWRTLLFFFAALGFVASTFAFCWLLVERRGRLRAQRADGTGGRAAVSR